MILETCQKRINPTTIDLNDSAPVYFRSAPFLFFFTDVSNPNEERLEAL